MTGASISKILAVREGLEETKEGGLRFKEVKTDAGLRDLPLPDIVVHVLREHRRRLLETRLKLGLGKLTKDTLLFAQPDGSPLVPNYFSKAWAKRAASIGLKGINFHALRHTHASMLIDKGIDVVKIRKRLGHASPTVTLEVYAHLFAKREDKSAAAINDAVAELLR